MKKATNREKQGTKDNKKGKIVWLSLGAAVGVVLISLVVYYAVVLIIGSTSDDGLGKYKGAEKELATKAVSDLKNSIDDKKRWAYTFHVDEVRETTADEIIKYCTPNNGEVTNNPDNPRFYTVTITTGETVNPNKRTVVIDGCNAFGPKKDGAYETR